MAPWQKKIFSSLEFLGGSCEASALQIRSLREVKECLVFEELEGVWIPALAKCFLLLLSAFIQSKLFKGDITCEITAYSSELSLGEIANVLNKVEQYRFWMDHNKSFRRNAFFKLSKSVLKGWPRQRQGNFPKSTNSKEQSREIWKISMKTNRSCEVVRCFTCLKHENEGPPILRGLMTLINFAFVCFLTSALIKIMFFFLFCRLMVLVWQCQSHIFSIRQSERGKIVPQSSRCVSDSEKSGENIQKNAFRNTVTWRFSIAKTSISSRIRDEYAIFQSCLLYKSYAWRRVNFSGQIFFFHDSWCCLIGKRGARFFIPDFILLKFEPRSARNERRWLFNCLKRRAQGYWRFNSQGGTCWTAAVRLSFDHWPQHSSCAPNKNFTNKAQTHFFLCSFEENEFVLDLKCWWVLFKQFCTRQTTLCWKVIAAETRFADLISSKNQRNLFRHCSNCKIEKEKGYPFPYCLITSKN